jgi:hypothetical protein
MRYRLRTLLIVVTLVAFPLSWISWVRRTADFHRREVVKVAHYIAEAEHASIDIIQEHIAILAHGRSVTKCVRVEIYGGRKLMLRNGGSQRHGPDVVDPNMWGKACFHAILAGRFDRAAFKPWTLIVETRIEPVAIYTSLNDETWAVVDKRDKMTDVKPQ